MRPNERAEFLAWLNRLSLEQLREVSSHVNAVITFKRGAVLRYLAPGSQIVFTTPDPNHPAVPDRNTVGTVVKLHRVSVLVELANGQRAKVEVDQILGLHVGNGEYAPIQSVAPTPFEGAGLGVLHDAHPQAPVESQPGDVPAGTFQQPGTEPYCRWCGEPGTPEIPLVNGPSGESFHPLCLEDFTTHRIPDLEE